MSGEVKAWKWLEQRFDSPHQSLKIITSPLSSSWHSTRCYQQDSFREIIIFISVPEGITRSGNYVPVMRRLFTELDHHYVNPVSERFKKSIETAIGDRLPHWNAGGSYGSPVLTFNEYMTWALFGIYLFDQIGDPSAIEMKPSIAFMGKDRGFKLFDQFYSELLSLYKRHPIDDLTNLYPPMIDWMGQQTAD